MPRVDRRHSVRYTVKRCTALFRRRRMLLFFEGDPPHKAPIVDLSSQGVSFVTKRTLRPGDVVLISFDIPFEVYAVPVGFRLKAQVKWIGAARGKGALRRVGCEFNVLKKDEHELVTRIIRYGILRER